MRVALIVNPIAGGGRAKKLAPIAIAKLKSAGYEVEVRESHRAGASTELASEAAKECELVVACGGDGTVFEVLNGIVETEATLGILPWGRGNDISKDLGLPQGIEEPIRALIDGLPRRVDAVETNGKFFLGVGGLGLDAQAAVVGNKYRKMLISDFIAYQILPLFIFLSYPPFPVEIKVDGETFTYEGTFLVSVGNTPTYARGMRILPEASFTDGKLDLCITTAPSRFHLFKLYGQVFSGQHVKDPGVHYFQASRVSVRALNGATVHFFADGEILGTLPAEFAIAPGKAKIQLWKGQRIG